MSRPNSKKFRYDSPPYSPRQLQDSPYLETGYQLQTNLSQKIHKLKHALKSSEKHNEQLHEKIKYYKDLLNKQVPGLQQELKRYKKKYGSLQQQHDKKLLEFHELRIKNEYQQRQVLSATKDKVNKIKQLQIKTIQFQNTILNLNEKVKQKQQKINDLQSILHKNRNENAQQHSKELSKLQKQLASKTKEAYDYSRQASTLRDSVKQMVRKIQKGNLTIYQQAQKYRLIQDEYKQSKKSMALLQKQISALRQSQQMSKQQSVEKVRCLQKAVMQAQFDKQRLSEKLTEQKYKNQKLSIQIQNILSQYRALQVKYEQLLQSNYDIQKDFERELQIIAKQMARRHMISKSMGGSTATSITSINQVRKRLPQYPHE